MQEEQMFQRQCLLHIVEVRNLPSKILRPYIKLTLERPLNGRIQAIDIGETPNQTFENPVYNRRF